MKQFIFCLLLIRMTIPAQAEFTGHIPDPLKSWSDWVLYGHEQELFGVPAYNDSKMRFTKWPAELTLSLDSNGGTFTQTWSLEAEGWITLPGSAAHWPDHVTANGKSVVILNRDGTPQIKSGKGVFRISGQFHWTDLPEFLSVPSESALVSLYLNGKAVIPPNLDAQGRLWLHSGPQKEEHVENHIKIQAFRMVRDRIPPEVTLLLKLDVAGNPREILLGPAFQPADFIPMQLECDLPARVEQDGRIRMQIRPGQYELKLIMRYTAQLHSLQFLRPGDPNWPGEEVWVFAARPELRVVDISGAPSIDPNQTALPEEWREYPAYRMVPDSSLIFTEKRRGDSQPVPDQLSLKRRVWLRFDGSGYTIQDQITGQKNTNRRMEMNPPIHLGRVVVDGRTQFITHISGSRKAGVELRRGKVDLTAESEYSGSISTIPLTGWDHNFQEVSIRLFLPPGYRLFHASGMDNVPQTWLTQWSLLDFFVVLVFTVAVAKLYSKSLAIVAFLTLVLTYHETGAPRWVWIAVVIGFALLKYLPRGIFKRMVLTCQVLVFSILMIILIPFAISQLRIGFYPQLEQLRQDVGEWGGMGNYASPAMAPAVVQDKVSRAEAALREEKSLMSRTMRYASKSSESRMDIAQFDPGLVNQTGPGLPKWSWKSVHLTTGPVQPGQSISLVVLGPGTNLLFAFLRVALLAVLIPGLFFIRYRKGSGLTISRLKKYLFVLLLIFSMVRICSAGEIPSQKLLNELSNRLLEPEDCFPQCADVSDMQMTVDKDLLTIRMRISSGIETAVPLPGSPDHWLPGDASIDGKQAVALYRMKSGIWIRVPEGLHVVEIRGRLFNTTQVALPLKPHHISVQHPGWTVEGLRADGSVDNQLVFKKVTRFENPVTEPLNSGILPPFAAVERDIFLGLKWQVETTVTRRNSVGSAMIFNVPLIPGESVITDGVVVSDGQVEVNMDAQQQQFKWKSILAHNDNLSGVIELLHAKTDQWTETWAVEVSPVLHLEYQGIPQILRREGDRRISEWHPWPGEKVTLTVTRPEGIGGQTLTIENSYLEIRPGRRVAECTLSLSIRSSKGCRHVVSIPPDAQLREIKINGKVQPVLQDGNRVPLPIVPGVQDISLKWLAHKSISLIYRTPKVNLNVRSANANITVKFPRNRWPLFLNGPRLGPAVLFWSVLIVILLAALGLSKSGLTPLKFRHWFFLGVGMSLSHIATFIIFTGWLIALDLRRKVKDGTNKWVFDALQLCIAFSTLIALGALVFAVSQGLLGRPDMSIRGNGSNGNVFKWYQDYTALELPVATIVSIPLYFYKSAMLIWALWIAFYLIRILKWGWSGFTQPRIWARLSKPRIKKKLQNPSG